MKTGKDVLLTIPKWMRFFTSTDDTTLHHGYKTGRNDSGVRTTFSHMATATPPPVLYTGFLDKTNIPRILTPRARYHRTLLQYPHGPFSEHFLALPGCTAAGGTRNRSPVPIYPLGLDETNVSRLPENIFILSSGRNQVCVARYASHYFSKGAIWTTRKKKTYVPYLRIELPGSFMWRCGALCEGSMRIELRLELYAALQRINNRYWQLGSRAYHVGIGAVFPHGCP